MMRLTLTHDDLAAMISEAVKRTLSARIVVTESRNDVFKFAMQKLAEKSWDLKRWAVKKQATLGALDTAFRKHTEYGTNREVTVYLDAKKKATHEYPWDIAIEFGQMSSEEQDSEIEKYLLPNLNGSDGDELSDTLSELSGRYAETDPEEMEFAELCSAIREINEVMDKFGAYEPGKKEIFEEYGIFDLKKRLMSVWKARR